MILITLVDIYSVISLFIISTMGRDEMEPEMNDGPILPQRSRIEEWMLKILAGYDCLDGIEPMINDSWR